MKKEIRVQSDKYKKKFGLESREIALLEMSMNIFFMEKIVSPERGSLKSLCHSLEIFY